MSLTAIIILVISAGLHATWNLIGKRMQPSLSFFLLSNVSATILLLPLLIIYYEKYLVFPTSVWVIVGFAGLSQTIYYAGLANAYRLGDMSLAYPLARSSPVLILLVAAVVLGKSEEIGIGCVIGIVLIVLGSFLLPMKHFKDLRFKNYANPVYLLALVAALGTTGYTLLDDTGLETLRNLPAQPFSELEAAFLYLVFEALASSVGIGFFVLVQRTERKRFLQVAKNHIKTSIITGFIIYITYGLVLWSMAYVDNVSYVAAFRQLSIPIGVIMGIMILKEAKTAPKILGVALIFVGLILVAML